MFENDQKSANLLGATSFWVCEPLPIAEQQFPSYFLRAHDERSIFFVDFQVF